MIAWVPRALAIGDRATLPNGSLVDWARQVAGAGVDAIQLREKGFGGGALFARACEMRAVIPAHIAFTVNGRLDVALAAGGCGVHLPERSPPLPRLRARFPELLIGKSCHTLDKVVEALEAGADYVTYGPVFAPLSKVSALPPVGLEGLALATELGVPVLALGGVTLQRLEDIASTGASGIAGIGLFQNTGGLAQVVDAVARLFPRRRRRGGG